MSPRYQTPSAQIVGCEGLREKIRFERFEGQATRVKRDS